MGVAIRNSKSLGINVDACTDEEIRQNFAAINQLFGLLHTPGYLPALQAGLDEIPSPASLSDPPVALGMPQFGMIMAGPDNANWGGPPEVPLVRLIPVDGPDGRNPQPLRVFDAVVPLAMFPDDTLVHDPDLPPLQAAARVAQQVAGGAGAIVPWMLAFNGEGRPPVAVVIGGASRPIGTVPTSSCASFFTEISSISGYDAGEIQVLTHDSGCLEWVTTAEC